MYGIIIARQHRLINRVFPYSLLVRLQHFFLPRRWVQELFFRRRCRLVRELAQDLPGADMPAAVLGSLMANTGLQWRSNIFLDGSSCGDWVKMEGFEQLENALSTDKGVILVITHTIGRYLFGNLLRARIPVDIFAIRAVDQGRDRERVSTAFAFQLVAAFKTLQSGGIVIIAGDGPSGPSYLELPILGHRFPFRSGFAELAIRSGAALMALFDNFNLDGRLTFELVEIPRLDSGTREAQVDAIVRNYAALLHQHQLQLISSLHWSKLEQISHMPRMAEITPAPTRLPGSTG